MTKVVGTRRLLEREKRLMDEVKSLKQHLEMMTKSKNRHKENCRAAYEKAIENSPDLKQPATSPQKDCIEKEVLVPNTPSAARNLDLTSPPRKKSHSQFKDTGIALKAPTIFDNPARQSTAGITVLTELVRLAEAGNFFPGPVIKLAKAMLFDSSETHYIGVPIHFPEKSRYRDAMITVAMTITKKTV